MKTPDNQSSDSSDNIDSVHTGLPFVCINNLNNSDQYINLINYYVKKQKISGHKIKYSIQHLQFILPCIKYLF